MCLLQVSTAIVAELRVVRTGGMFGQVTIPFEVMASETEGAMLSDLSSSRGSLFFDQNEQFRVTLVFHVWFITHLPTYLFATDIPTGSCYG